MGQPSPVERHRTTLGRLRAEPGSLDLPQRFSLFGHTRIPVTEVELLEALGAHRDVHLWLPHPSDALWQALSDLRGAVPRAVDESHERVGIPACRRWGVTSGSSSGRGVGGYLEPSVEWFRTLAGARSSPTGAAPETLLSWLQDDLGANAIGNPARRTIAADDTSVQVHSCHGPARQVEVLREVLLGLLADDPTLEPRDILVMCPDIEVYAPLITAAFGMGAIVDESDRHHPGHQFA